MATTPIELIAQGLRRERVRAGFSLSELARKASVGKSTLSQLEAGSGNPSIETLWALADALGIPFSRLIVAPPISVRIVRSDEGAGVRSSQSDYTSILLSACAPGVRRDVYRLVLQPGKKHVSEGHLPGTIEHLVLSSGRAKVGPLEDPVELEPGDYICYPGDVRHVFEALVDDTTAVIIMENAG